MCFNEQKYRNGKISRTQHQIKEKLTLKVKDATNFGSNP